MGRYCCRTTQYGNWIWLTKMAIGTAAATVLIAGVDLPGKSSEAVTPAFPELHPAAAGAQAGIASGQPTGLHVPENMDCVPGGRFLMGFVGGHDDEKAVHEVELNPFLLDRYEVTNRDFAAFVEATRHVTQAERDGSCWCFLEGESDFQSVPGAE